MKLCKLEHISNAKLQPVVFLALMILFFFIFDIYSRETFFNNSISSLDKFQEPAPITNSTVEIRSNTRRHILWPTDQQCKKFDVRFGHDISFKYLASFPRSGNTWTRYLIEAATGIFTGSIYASKILYGLGYLGETDDPEMGRVIVVKTHGNNVKNPKKVYFKKGCETPVILLIRNVENSTLSFWSFLQERSLFLNAKSSSYKTKEFRKKLRKNTSRWVKMNKEILVNCSNIMVIFYEDLMKDPMREVGRILQFLHFEADEERLECLRKHIEGPAKRKHKHIDPFTKEDKRNFIESMRKVVRALEMKGVAPPLEYYDYINKEID